MKNICSFLFFKIILLISLQSIGEIWPVTAKWTDQTEEAYAKWVELHGNADFFSNPDRELQALIDVDCARATYAMRMVFAKLNGLPYKLIGNSGRMYDSTKDNGSFINFARQAISDSSTLTMKNNSFPISIDRKNVRPGVVYLFQVPDDRGVAVRHAYLVKKVTPAGVTHFIWANVPAAKRNLSERIQFPYHMVTKATLTNSWGFRRFMQPQDYDLKEKLDSLSLELAKYDSLNSADGRVLGRQLWELSASIRQRGYNETDQAVIAEAALRSFTNELTKLARTKGIQTEFNFSGFNFKSFSPRGKGLPLLPVAIQEFVSDANDISENALSIIKYYQIELAKRLRAGNTIEPLQFTLEREFLNTCFYIRERVGYVEEGYRYFFKRKESSGLPIMKSSNNFNRPINTNSEEVFNFSSPARDRDMAAFFQGVGQWYKQNREKIKIYDFWFQIFEVTFADAPELSLDANENLKLIKQVQSRISQFKLSNDQNDVCSFPINYENASGQELLDPREVRLRFAKPGLISSQPWLAKDRRWGKKSVSAAEFKKENNPYFKVITEVIKQETLF